MAERNTKKEFNDYYNINYIKLLNSLNIREIMLKEPSSLLTDEFVKDFNQLSLSERIQLTQLKTLLEIKDMMIDDIIERATRWRKMK